MSVFIDTSGFLAVLNAEDKQHQNAKRVWENLLSREETLVCSNYVLIETLALLQHRFGMDAVRTFQEDVVPILIIDWIDEPLHQSGILSLLAANRKELSLVDCISFAVMRKFGINQVFAFDSHFRQQGFECIP